MKNPLNSADEAPESPFLYALRTGRWRDETLAPAPPAPTSPTPAVGEPTPDEPPPDEAPVPANPIGPEQPQPDAPQPVDRHPATRAMEPTEFKRTQIPETAEHRAYLWRDFKAVDDNAGIFEGYLAVFSNLDDNGDVIDKGAFTKTLKEAHEVKNRAATPFLFPVLWQHNSKEPIGGFTEAYEDDHGLFVRGRLDLNIEQGKRAYSGMKMGYLRGLSIGYDAVKSIYQKNARHLLEIRLFEGSPVTFAANAESSVMSVKAGEGPTEFEDMSDDIVDEKGVSGKTAWPLAERDHAWDAGAAHARLLEWAGGKDNLNTAKFSSVHFWSPDGADRKNVSDYKLPFCDVVNGSVRAIPKAIFAVAGVVNGARGGVQGVDAGAVKSRVGTYYRKMAKQFNDDGIKAPWSAKALLDKSKEELKQLAGLQALTSCATSLDNVCDGAEGLVETLAGACGMSLEDEDVGKPAPAVAALLGGVDGLPEAVTAVIKAWQEFDVQTDALLATLGLPDDDTGYGETAVPMYMSQLRSAFELKVGRQLSSNNRTRLEKHAAMLQSGVEEVKSILRENDTNPLADENAPAADYGDVIASGQHNRPGSKGAEGARDRSRTTGTTPTSTATDEPADQATRTEFEAMLFAQQMDLMGHKGGRRSE